MGKKHSILRIEKIGLLELMFALYPIVAGYSYGSIHMSILWPIVMDLVALTRKQGLLRYPLLLIVFIFVIFHEIVVLFLDGFLSSHINTIISYLIIFISIFIISKAVDYTKMVGSLYLISYLACGGIIYHFILLLSGDYINPIPLPFFPAPDTTSLLYREVHRPCSFFWEPASFVSYMLTPLFIALTNNDKQLSLFFLFCIFLSTSTNGLFLAPIMFLVYILNNRQRIKNRLVYVIFLGGLVIMLYNSSIFKEGRDKMVRTDYTENVRTSNGPWLVSRMPTEHLILGMPEYTANHYLENNFISGERVGERDLFYLSDFWRIWVTYGIIGLILHFSVYFNFVKKEKTLWPLIVSLLVAHFSIDSAYKDLYLYQFCFIIAYILNSQKALVDDNLNSQKVLMKDNH